MYQQKTCPGDRLTPTLNNPGILSVVFFTVHVLLYSVTVPSHQEGAWSVEVLRSWLLQLPKRPPLKAAG